MIYNRGDNKMITHKDFFFFYDIKLSDHLIRKGCNFVTYAIHPKSHKTFYMFHRSEGLESLINEYKEKMQSAEGLI